MMSDEGNELCIAVVAENSFLFELEGGASAGFLNAEKTNHDNSMQRLVV